MLGPHTVCVHHWPAGLLIDHFIHTERDTAAQCDNHTVLNVQFCGEGFWANEILQWARLFRVTTELETEQSVTCTATNIRIHLSMINKTLSANWPCLISSE